MELFSILFPHKQNEKTQKNISQKRWMQIANMEIFNVKNKHETPKWVFEFMAKKVKMFSDDFKVNRSESWVRRCDGF